jgi:flagellar export protein FliJ
LERNDIVKRFRFALDRLMNWRRLQCDQEEARLGQLVSAATALARSRETLQVMADREHRLVLGGRSPVSNELEALGTFRRHVAAEDRRMASRLTEMSQHIHAQREKLLEAKRKWEALSKLRERRQQEWKHEVDKEMEEMTADLVVARWSNRKAG